MLLEGEAANAKVFMRRGIRGPQPQPPGAAGDESMFGRVVAWFLIVVAGLVLAREAYMFLETGTYTPVAVAQLWYDIHRGSLNFVQTTLEQHLHPFLWDPLLFTVLQWPATLVFGIPGIALLLSTRSPKKKKRKWRSGSFE
jgi:hypothetical protein